MFQHLMTHFITRTRSQLVPVTPFIHRPKSLLAPPISCSQTLSSLQFSTDTSAFSHHPIRLPEDLSRNVTVLSCESSAEGGVCHVYLLGTSHVSKESSREAQAIVKFLKPQVVFLELCSSRASILTRKNLKIHVPTDEEMVTMLKRKHHMFEVLYGWCCAKRASELDVLPGNEFRVAYQEAIKYGAKVILGDRPIHITLRRTWSKMPLWYILKLLYFKLFCRQHFPISGGFKKKEMNKEFPTLMETLVHERDQVLGGGCLGYGSGIDILCIF
ncbi:traB domain-containing protein-like isoform X2 [Vigna unguiculata]|uniref:traB domain-containing protein-like isoform X2 n=1 Tax=Vigna unguiculata TaxID=3917 RepID=UPI001016F21A|nr:traB domain-containing protein-like isoform X2 [Vigna unguiculata]